MNDKDFHKQVIKNSEVLPKIMVEMKKADIIGATIKSGFSGVYNGEIEKSVEIVLVDVTKEQVEKFVNGLKTVFNQECVMVEELEAKVQFA